MFFKIIFKIFIEQNFALVTSSYPPPSPSPIMWCKGMPSSDSTLKWSLEKGILLSTRVRLYWYITTSSRLYLYIMRYHDPWVGQLLKDHTLKLTVAVPCEMGLLMSKINALSFSSIISYPIWYGLFKRLLASAMKMDHLPSFNQGRKCWIKSTIYHQNIGCRPHRKTIIVAGK